MRWSENFKFGGDWPGGPDPEGFLFSRMWKAKNIPLASFLLHYKEGVMDLSRAGFALLDKILRRCICCSCPLHLLRHNADQRFITCSCCFSPCTRLHGVVDTCRSEAR